MTLGEKLKNARLEAGLSQRQLCGEEITRNMLSQIENGSARPSMDTLRFLAQRLGKPMSFFLEEDAVLSPNQAIMARARAAWKDGACRQVLEALSAYRSPDPVFDPERGLLEALSTLALAETAIQEEKHPYAARLLEGLDPQTPYYTRELEHRRLTLLSEAGGDAVLPSLDGALLLRARQTEDPIRAAQLLDAAEDHTVPLWNLLRGQAYAALGQFQAAMDCLKAAEEAYPKQTAPPAGTLLPGAGGL